MTARPPPTNPLLLNLLGPSGYSFVTRAPAPTCPEIPKRALRGIPTMPLPNSFASLKDVGSMPLSCLGPSGLAPEEVRLELIAPKVNCGVLSRS